MNNWRLHILVFALLAAGVGAFLYKLLVLHFPLSPNRESSTYTVEAKLFFSPRSKEPVQIKLHIPTSSSRYVITDENFVSRGYGLNTAQVKESRQAVWSTREAKGDQYLFYQAVIQKVEGSAGEFPMKKPEVISTTFSEAQLVAAQDLLLEVQGRSADLDSLMSELIKIIDKASRAIKKGAQPTQGAVDLLLEGKYSRQRKADVAVNVLALANIPARVVHGLPLQDQNGDVKLTRWLEVFDSGLWKPYSLDPDEHVLPDNYFAWWRGTESLYLAKGANSVLVNFAVRKNQEAGLNISAAQSEARDSSFYQFSLFQLPVGVQGVYRILLAFPLGALIVILFKNVVGLSTFGTFMPVLVACAFRETKLVAGIILLFCVMAAGLSVRAILERLRLLLVPKLAMVLTTVILLFAAISIVSHRLGFEEAVSVALFPMVIITMLIERMSIVWEELGSADAIKQGFSSLLVAALVFAVITNPNVEHVMFVFPELNLVLLAIMAWLGRYTGYRLMELRRFEAFTEER